MSKEKDKTETAEKKTMKALVTSRVLFISALDKIYLIILGLMFLAGTYAIFYGSISSLNYGFWGRVGKEIVFLIILFIVYLFFNWLYRCAAKTMLCLTKNEVYKETYVPFKRSESSIPLDKITKVTTIDVLWIFRTLIIHQYHAFPIIFMTWNNQEFKDKLNELLTTDNAKIENEYENRNIIIESMYKYLKYVAIAFAGIILLIGIVRFFNYVFSSEKNMAGTYTNKNNSIILGKDGVCDISDLVDDVTKCEWSYDIESQYVAISYEYEYEYGYYYTRTETRSDTEYLKFDSDKKALVTQDNVEYQK